MRVGRRWLRGVVYGAATIVGLIVLLLAVSALSNLGLPRRADSDRLSEAQKARAAESIHLRRTLGDNVWPGWGALHIPQIVYNERYAFLVGYPGMPAAGWYREPEHVLQGGDWSRIPGDSVAAEPIYRQELTRNASPEAFTVRVGDHWVGSMPTLEWSRIRLGRELRDQLPPVIEWLPPYRLLGALFFRGTEHQVSLILHETFHAFQGASAPEHFARAEQAANRSEGYPSGDSAFTAAWREELGLLADALEATDARETERLARSFLEARSARRGGMSPELQDYESRREWLEGLAKYVELEVWWAADTTASYTPTAAVRAQGLDTYADASKAFAREVGQLRRSASQGETRFYYSGMAQAKLLDQLHQDWKGAAVPGGRFLEDLLALAVQFEQPTMSRPSPNHPR